MPKATAATLPDDDMPHDDSSPLDNFISEADAEIKALAEHVDKTDATAKQEAEQNKLILEGTQAFVSGLLDAGEVKLRAQLPYVKIDPDEKTNLAAKAAPVLMKYQAGPPAWMLPYMAEFALLAAAGSLAFSIWSQVNAHKLELLEKERQVQEQRDRGQQQGAMPAEVVG